MPWRLNHLSRKKLFLVVDKEYDVHLYDYQPTHMTDLASQHQPWRPYQRVLFRIFFIYFLLSTATWSWLGSIPWFSFLSTISTDFSTFYTELFNDYIYQVKEELVPTRGSGDTSMGWATLYAQLFLSVTGGLLWSLIDRKRPQYYWSHLFIRNIVRYYIILFAFIYGVIKIYGLQMPSPSNSYYATDLGHFSGMRFSWNFIGYSKGYEFFSGLMEVFVGVFLLYRRTIVLGALLGIGVFANVFLLNISYDIPVKIFSFQLLFACAFICLNNLKRISQFLILNQPVTPDTSWDIPHFKPWVKPAQIALKSIFIFVFVLYPFYNYYSVYTSVNSRETTPPFQNGFYEVQHFILNGDTIASERGSKWHWQEVAIDQSGRGSIGLVDSTLRIRYGRSYFNYELDSTATILTIKRAGSAPFPLFKGTYEKLNDRDLQLSGTYKSEHKLQVQLIWQERDYALARKEFNWMLESVP